MIDLPEGEDEDEEEEKEPNPWPGATGLLGEELGSGLGSASTVGFWDLIENLGFGKMEWR